MKFEAGTWFKYNDCLKEYFSNYFNFGEKVFEFFENSRTK